MSVRKSVAVSMLAGSIALMLASGVWAVAFSIFMDTDNYIDRAKEIVIVEVIGDIDPRPPGDDPSTVDVNVLMSL